MRYEALKKLLAPVIAAAIVCLLGAPVSAGPLVPNCSFSSTGITFNQNYDVFAPNQLTSVGKIMYSCTGFSKPVSVTIDLSPGYSGTVGHRMLKGRTTSAMLAYQLHEGSLDVEWGNGINGWHYGTTQSPDSKGNFSDQRTVQAKIMPGQDVPADTYQDVIVGTFAFNF